MDEDKEPTPEETPEEEPEVEAPAPEDEPDEQSEVLTLSRVKTLDVGNDAVETLAQGKRILGLKAVPFGVVADSRYGRIMFQPGAFGEVDPTKVRLRMDHADPPTGRGMTYEERPEGAFLEFKVSKTQRGDEQLELARDGTSVGASIGFMDIVGAPEVRKIDGQHVTVYGPNSARLAEVSTTWQPTFEDAGVTHMLKKENNDMADAVDERIEKALQRWDQNTEKTLGAFEEWREAMRSQVSAPAPTNKSEPKFLNWLTWALKTSVGEPMTDIELKRLDLEDVLLVDQNVPAAVRSEVVAFVNDRRPFLSSTTQLAPPDGAQALSIPVMTQSPEAGVQSAEKTEVASRALKIENALIQAVTVAGAVDVSMQFIRRGPRTYFDLLRRGLMAAYAAVSESEAIDHLLDGITVGTGPGTTYTPQDGGTIDPDNLVLGEAWTNTFDVAQVPPDTMWLSPAGYAAFLDAKASTTNAPLYGNLNGANFAAGSISAGSISGLRVVLVPALTAAGIDAIVGPSNLYAWAEDGTFELQVDKPGILGRDIALAGFMFYMPLAPAAFTTYSIASS